MKKEKVEVLKKEFPFLTEILNTIKFDLAIGQIKIKQVNSSFLRTIPRNYYWSGAAGRHSILERLFVVNGNDVKEVPIEYEIEDITAGSYARYFKEGQTILSSLIEKGYMDPDYLVWCSSEKITFDDNRDSDIVTIYKPINGETISQAWVKELQEAVIKLKEEAMKIDSLNNRLIKYLHLKNKEAESSTG